MSRDPNPRLTNAISFNKITIEISSFYRPFYRNAFDPNEHRLVQIQTISDCVSVCIFCHDISLLFILENLFHRNKSSGFLLFAIVFLSVLCALRAVCVSFQTKKTSRKFIGISFSLVCLSLAYYPKWASQSHDHFYIFIAYCARRKEEYFCTRSQAICIRFGLAAIVRRNNAKTDFKRKSTIEKIEMKALLFIECICVFVVHRDLSLCFWLDIICLVSRIQWARIQRRYLSGSKLCGKKMQWNEPFGYEARVELRNEIVKRWYWKMRISVDGPKEIYFEFFRLRKRLRARHELWNDQNANEGEKLRKFDFSIKNPFSIAHRIKLLDKFFFFLWWNSSDFENYYFLTEIELNHWKQWLLLQQSTP